MADQNLKDLEVPSGTPTSLLVGGKLFKAGMLNALDFAECSAWKASTQAASLLALPNTNPMVDQTAIRAEAVSKILTKAFEPKDLIGDANCILRLAEISLRRGGEWKGNFEGFKKNLDPVTFRDLEILVLKMSGYWTTEVEKAANANPPLPQET